MPVIKHYKGVCHLYVDASADLAMAVKVVVNSKVQRPACATRSRRCSCTRHVAAEFLPGPAAAMPQVELRGCPRTRAILPGVVPATEEDWDAEYLDLVLAVRVVDGCDGGLRAHRAALLAATPTASSPRTRRSSSGSWPRWTPPPWS